MKNDPKWQELAQIVITSEKKMSYEQIKIIREYLSQRIETLEKVERAPLYEGLTQDSSKGQAAYLAKLAEESALYPAHGGATAQ